MSYTGAMLARYSNDHFRLTLKFAHRHAEGGGEYE